MKIWKFKIQPRTRLLGIDVRPFFVWLEKIEKRINDKKRKALLDIHDIGHKGE